MVMRGMPPLRCYNSGTVSSLLPQEPVGPVFGQSIRRGIAQADAGEAIVCRNYDDMVEKLLGKE
jgi:hypothetical protein